MANSRVVPKKVAFVVVVLTDGATLEGQMFLNDHSRMSDVLNDDRKFLPLRTMDGSMIAVAKPSIKQVTLPAHETAYLGRDPYRILGVQQGATPEEIKRVYHELSKVNHPDIVKGFGLGAEYQELASKIMTRINSAYSEILRTTQAAA
jgi:DnaJ-domain-containing protein 1